MVRKLLEFEYNGFLFMSSFRVNMILFTCILNYSRTIEFFSIIMELCSQSLRKWLQTRNADESAFINRPLMYRWFLELLEGLKYLHEYEGTGIIHRDLKPDNVLMTGGSRIKICDFGLGKDDIDATNTKGIGTELYQPPEQANGHYSARADIYPCGKFFR